MNLEVLRRRPEPRPDPVGEDVRPVVAPPSAGLPGIAIAAIAAILAVLLFVMLDGQRRRAASESVQPEQAQTSVFATPPPLAVPPEAAPAPPTVVTIPVAPLPPAPVRQPQLQRQMSPDPVIVPMAPPAPEPISPAPTPSPQRLADPALIYDVGTPTDESGKPAANPQAAPSPSPPSAARRTSMVQAPARPTRIANPGMVVPAGTLIKAVLETPIDTSRPGLARAIVSKGARGFDGQRVLIPRGSRLIGEYDADVRTGQRKVLVNWTQLVRPDGSMIKLDSPAADAMGGSGVPGHVNSFFFQRFFNAVLQSALTLGGTLATWSSNAPVVVASTSPVTTVAGQGGLVGQTPQPKITVKQGTAFNVFVARDLDFSGSPVGRSVNGQ